MPRPDRNHIVADGRGRIMEGTACDAAARVRARLSRRAVPLIERTSLVGRLIIRYRISRFVRRQIDRLAPPGGLYSSRGLSLLPTADCISSFL
jgi:hypothetical protein